MLKREEYEKLGAGLPSYEDVNFHFEIDQVDESSFPLRAIRRRVMERVEACMKSLEEAIHPDGGVTSMIESLTDKQRERAIKLYKELGHLCREGQEIGMRADLAAEAQFVAKATQRWPSVRERMAAFFGVLKGYWEEDHKDEADRGYFG